MRTTSLAAQAALAALALLACAAGADAMQPAKQAGRARAEVRVWPVEYRASTGARRKAYVVVPAWYGRDDDPKIPLVISPHGRGVSGLANARMWRKLPARGWFAVVNPDGQGRRFGRYSWGYSGQIADLARMPRLVTRALPWLRVDPHRIYAVGSSMGGQEALLLLARHPRLLAGAAVFDSVTDLARQYRELPLLRCRRACERRWVTPMGIGLQERMRVEVGGSPATTPAAYASRSPLTYARRIAFSCVPLQLWWSRTDRVVLDQAGQSGKLFRTIRRLNPAAPVTAFVGNWVHSAEMREGSRLSLALRKLGLLSYEFARTKAHRLRAHGERGTRRCGRTP